MARNLGRQNMFEIKTRFVNFATSSVVFLHGFTESSQCFEQAWDLPGLSDVNVFMPDFPGFGKSSLNAPVDIFSIVNLLYEAISKELNPLLPLYIVGHSLGGAIGTKLLEKMVRANKKCFLIDVDGLILPEKEGTSSLAFSVDYDSPQAYKNFMIHYWSLRVNNDPCLRRYLGRIENTPPEVLHSWAKASVFFLEKANILDTLLALKKNMVYLYGINSVNKRNALSAINAGLDCVEILNAGHWPMLENPDSFWKKIIQYL